MIVTFDKEILSAAVTPAMSAVSNKNTITSIEGICITAEADGTCILNSFDLEKGIRCTLKGRVEEPGSRETSRFQAVYLRGPCRDGERRR